MSQYELALVLNPNLSDDDLNSQFDSIKNMLEKSGASIEKIDNWGKKNWHTKLKNVTSAFITSSLLIPLLMSLSNSKLNYVSLKMSFAILLSVKMFRRYYE